MIFVFGSNLAGRHGKGAALHAAKYFGAVRGVGIGPSGSSYAIPTKDGDLNTLPLDTISKHIKDFLEYASLNADKTFLVTPVGTGLAGYKKEEIRPMFDPLPTNCILADTWN